MVRPAPRCVALGSNGMQENAVPCSKTKLLPGVLFVKKHPPRPRRGDGGSVVRAARVCPAWRCNGELRLARYTMLGMRRCQ